MNATVPQQCHAAECPGAKTARGWATGLGALPPKSGICILLDSPDSTDGAYLVKDMPNGLVEIERRRSLALEDRWTRMGVLGQGRVRTPLWYWTLGQMGLQSSDVCVFSMLNCCQGEPLKGAVRKRAEATCADLWLRPLVEWEPTISVVGMEPRSLLGDVTPLPVLLRAIEKSKKFAAAGERVVLLMGGRPTNHWLGYGSNETRYAGHWQSETTWTRAARAERWNANRRLTVVKVAKVRKLTVKAALAQLLDGFTVPFDDTYTSFSHGGPPLSKELLVTMRALCETKKRGKGVTV